MNLISGLRVRLGVMLPLGGLISGIGLGLKLPWNRDFIWGWVCFGFFLVAALFFRQVSYRLKLVVLFLIFFIFGLLRIQDQLWDPSHSPVKGWVQTKASQNIVFQALDYCRIRNDKNQVKVQMIGYYLGEVFFEWSETILLRLGGTTCDIIPHAYYRTLATFQKPRRFKNPSSFDYPFFLRVQGIRWTAWVKSYDWVVELDPAVSVWQRWVYDSRNKILRTFDQHIVNEEVRALMKAFLLRDKSEISKSLEDKFRRTGLSHLMVVSGFHLGMIFSFWFLPSYFVLAWVRFWQERGRSKTLALLLSLVPTFFYASMVGFNASLLRAMVFSVGIVVYWLGQTRRDFFWILFLSVLLLLGYDPLLLLDLGFQFSFLAVLAIALSFSVMGPVFQRWEERFSLFKNNLFKRVCWVFISSVFIQVMLWPLLSWRFHEVSWLAPVNNFLMLPLVIFLLMPLLVFSALVSLLSVDLASYLMVVLEEVGQIFLWILEFLAERFGLSVWSGFWSWQAWIFYFGILLFLLWGIRGWRRVQISLVFIFCFGLLWFYSGGSSPRTKMTWTMLDVGQGESLLLKLPNGQNFLMDGGGFPFSEFDIGRAVVFPALLKNEMKILRAVILTHLDADHSQGLKYILEHFSVEEFWVSSRVLGRKEMKVFEEICQKKGILIRTLKAGDFLQEGEVVFEVLWPIPVDSEMVGVFDDSDNNQSLVLKICYRKVCFLGTGDIESGVEKFLANEDSQLESAALKLAHHGSKTSSRFDFLKAVRPRVAIVSLGERNRFGFPHKEVLSRIQKLGMVLLRTDRHGQITVETDGYQLWYHTYRGEIRVGPAPIQ